MLIALINKSTTITNAEVTMMVQALNRQMRAHVAPTWAMLPATIVAGNAADAFPIYLFDSLSAADALGFQTEDEEGRIFGKVFVDPILYNGGTVYATPRSVTTAVSQEVIEAFVDYQCSGWTLGAQGRLYAYEVCAPVASDAYILGVGDKKIFVSNFVTPAWFEVSSAPDARFDHLGRLKTVFGVTDGGYAVYMSSSVSHEIFAELGTNYPAYKVPGLAHPMSRTTRRNAQIIQAV